MFHGHLDSFQKPPLGGRPNTKPGDHGTPNAHNRWFILFYHVWGPAWIEIHWNSIWLRAQLHMTSHYTWGFVITLHDCGGALGRPLDTFVWALTISWSRLLTHVWSGPQCRVKTWYNLFLSIFLLWCLFLEPHHSSIGVRLRKVTNSTCIPRSWTKLPTVESNLGFLHVHRMSHLHLMQIWNHFEPRQRGCRNSCTLIAITHCRNKKPCQHFGKPWLNLESSDSTTKETLISLSKSFSKLCLQSPHCRIRVRNLVGRQSIYPSYETSLVRTRPGSGATCLTKNHLTRSLFFWH